MYFACMILSYIASEYVVNLNFFLFILLFNQFLSFQYWLTYRIILVLGVYCSGQILCNLLSYCPDKSHTHHTVIRILLTIIPMPSLFYNNQFIILNPFTFFTHLLNPSHLATVKMVNLKFFPLFLLVTLLQMSAFSPPQPTSTQSPTPIPSDHHNTGVCVHGLCIYILYLTLFPFPHSVTPPPSPLTVVSLFHVSMPLFLFCSLDSTHK